MESSSTNLKSRKRRLGVFDFDHTIVLHNTDTTARDLLPPPLLKSKELNDIAETKGWTDYMAEIFRMLSEQYVSEKCLRDNISIIPEVPGFVRLLKRLKHNYDYDLIIISDSNSIFIDEWLAAHRLKDCFVKIFTNPAEFDEKGRLHIRPYHDQTDCKLSARNLCKGRVLEHFVISQDLRYNIHYDTVIYVGDGNNDVCPVLRLRDCDIACPRIGYAMEKNIAKNHDKLKVRARIISWKNGFELLARLEAEEALIKPIGDAPPEAGSKSSCDSTDNAAEEGASSIVAVQPGDTNN